MTEQIQATLGQKLAPILEEIENTLWDFEYYCQSLPPKFPEEALRSATKIFSACIWDKIWEKAQKEGMIPDKIDELANRAEQFGNDVRQLVIKYTGVDPHSFYTEKSKKTS